MLDLSINFGCTDNFVAVSSVPKARLFVVRVLGIMWHMLFSYLSFSNTWRI